ncbi:MAG: cation-translocating P-type ATPase [Ruminococcaceae bacterium]|nr:cation-translocating P-type ATPase [Oscillospiraceae bacterium]
MKAYCEELTKVYEEVKSNENGISDSEAAIRLEANGKNKLAEAKSVPLIVRFFKQLADPMIIILIVAAAISAITSLVQHGTLEADVFIILAVVLINAVLGVYQENKAEKAIEALQEMSAATSKVIRNGVIKAVKSEDLVVGDVVILEAGDAVPADGRIIESASLKIEEAALTGESVPVTKAMDVLMMKDGKDIPLGDRKNMVYMGSTVSYGRGKAVITATGMDTEMGKIADALAKAEEGQTPLQIKLAQLSKILTFLVVGICVIIFGVGVIKAGEFSGAVMLDSFMVAISLAVAAIPEGLAAVVTVVLSIGVTNMSKRNAIIRKLTAVETLGCAQIICSDKTGTLTQNKMTVVDYYGSDEAMIAIAMACCSDAQLGESGDAEGEPTECALVNYAKKLEMPKNELNDEYKRIGEVPFDSSRKMMTTVHEKEGNLVQFTKGAPDVILDRCTSYLAEDKILPLDDEKKQEIIAANKAMADRALRVLAAAMKTLDAEPAEYSSEAMENDLIFVGLTGMIDPVRPEVLGAVTQCKEAGIKAIMITGDHKDTAVAIAKELGIITTAEEAVTGSELDALSDEELDVFVEKYSVYARVQPEHKVRIVNAWRRKGCVTAMTGDGVNDAPSIKSADIGIGMGITGTDVTKNVADMVLADDNFATIVGAVGEGRRIYSNIRKSIQFLLASNMSEVISIFAATLLGFTILKPVHLLWINLITDCFPALALGVEKAEDDIMKQPPRSSKDGIFSNGVGFDVAYQGIVVSILTLAAFYVGEIMAHGSLEGFQWMNLGDANKDGMTMAFLTMSMAEIFHSFNMRSQKSSLFKIKTFNPTLFIAGAASLVLTTIVLYVPFLADAFEFSHISIQEYFVALGLAVLVIPIVEVVKAIERAIDKKKK